MIFMFYTANIQMVKPIPEPQKEHPETRPPRAPAKNGQMALAAASNMPFQSMLSFMVV